MSGNVKISFLNPRVANSEIRLSGSKSESNRALILQAISKGVVKTGNLSDAEDTRVLARCLQTIAENRTGTKVVDIGPAGTAMRFMTAYLSVLGDRFILTGSARMKERPIRILVDALVSVGAKIEYLDNEGFPPIEIQPGFKQLKDHVRISGRVSSQYISALMLIGAALPLGLTIEIEDSLTSTPYVEMTRAMLSQSGIKTTWNSNKIHISHQTFNNSVLHIEPDWSAASYWYAIAALMDSATFMLTGLKPDSLQGDRVIAEIMADFGVSSQFTSKGIQIANRSESNPPRLLDLKDCPDLAQTLIVYCALAGHNIQFTGLETLKIKETDRILALQTELTKIGVTLHEKDFVYTLNTKNRFFPDEIFINTYHDHRMAMAFAPLALFVPSVTIEHAEVVNKSYPGFWNDLKIAGFTVKNK